MRALHAMSGSLPLGWRNEILLGKVFQFGVVPCRCNGFAALVLMEDEKAGDS